MNEYKPNGVQRGAVATRASGPPDMLVEALTKREREILELIGTGASNQDIAHALVLARDTIKKHVYHIFGKLGVKNRIQAVVKAQVLNLH
jgi:LuxR family maltose regulon positive regulatory protein